MKALDGKLGERLAVALGVMCMPVFGCVGYGLLVLAARALKWLAS